MQLWIVPYCYLKIILFYENGEKIIYSERIKELMLFSCNFLLNTDAKLDGQARTVTSALLTLGVFTAHAIAHGNVIVSLDGAVCCVTKVISTCNCSTVFHKCQVWVSA
jgi:hypothetical protein